MLCSQKMKVVPVEKKSYGKFHTGDSYICLNVGYFLCFACIIVLEISISWGGILLSHHGNSDDIHTHTGSRHMCRGEPV